MPRSAVPVLLAVVALLAQAAVVLPASASGSHYETTPPLRPVASSPYVTGGHVTIAFDYAVTALTCPVSSNCSTSSGWQVRLGGTGQDGTVADGGLDGDLVAAGTFAQPSHGETQENRVEAPVDADALAAGQHLVTIAVRPLDAPGVAWRAATLSFEKLGADDLDADGVPDALEARLCARPVEASFFARVNGAAGTCSGAFDLAPPASTATILLPLALRPGVDADGDGTPSTIDVRFTEVQLVRGASPRAAARSAGSTIETLDDRDDAGAWPFLGGHCTTFRTPTSILTLQDADGDGVPGLARVTLGEVCSDVREPGWFEIRMANRHREISPDADDADAATPGGASFTTAPLRVAVSYGPDADGDGIPSTLTSHALTLTYAPLDPAAPAPARAISLATGILDPEDANRTSPVPYVPLDPDFDRVPVAAEAHLCLVEDPTDGLDGICRNHGLEYVPPDNYVSGFGPNPRSDVPFGGVASPLICWVESRNSDADGTCDVDGYHPPTLA